MYTIHTKIKIPDSKIVNTILAFYSCFTSAKKELYLVGGCIRDLLLDKTPKDYDLCTDATPEEVKQILSHCMGLTFIDTGLKHGTITVHDTIHDTFIEITTYRIDGKSDDCRHPNEVIFTPSLEEDLKRRDFTINSFAYDLLYNNLIMLDQSYLDDLHNGVIRAVGNPTQRFTEDALRMLRAFRFAAQLGFTIEYQTYKAIEKCAHLLSKISKERIRDELTKILLSDNPRYLELIVCADLEPYMFYDNTPMTDMLMCEHQNPWHYTDVFHHTLDVIERVPKNFELRWAALFHDMGKPSVKKQRPKGPEGHYVYYNHPEKSAEIAAKLMDILKFSTEQKCKIIKFVRLHDIDLAECNVSTFKKYLAEIGIEDFLDFIKLRVADASAHQLYKDTKHVIDATSIIYDRYSKVIKEKQPLYVTDLAVDGNDMKELGFEGKRIGEVLNYLLKKTYSHPSYNNREQLLAIAKRYLETSVDK